jgi:predicted signal transduction protein with EAL and GGDEF domain
MLNRPEDSEVVARKLAGALAQPVEIDGNRLAASASVGIAISPWDGQHADSLLKAADLAMYLSKRHGGGQHRFFDPEMTLPPRRAA